MPPPGAPGMKKGGKAKAKAKKKAKGGKMAKGGECKDKMATGGAAKQRRGFPNTQAPPKKVSAAKYAKGGKVRGCGIAERGTRFSGIY
jgi:hypothetical protein